MSDNVRRDNRRALPKYLLTILLFGLLGGVLGFFTGVAGAAGVAETVRQALDRVLAVCAPWGIVGSAVVLLGAGWYLYAAAKRRFAAWDGEDEDAMDAAEQQLSWALLLTGLVIILDFFFFAASIIYDRFLPDLILFLASVAVLVVLQQKIVDLERRINPEKRGSVYDMKFQKTWMDSCDEAERAQIGQACYRAYMVGTKVCIFLWVALLILNFVFDFGLLPIAAVLAVTLLQARTARGRVKLEAAAEMIPALRGVVRKQALARYVWVLDLYLASGMPAEDSLRAAAEVVTCGQLKKAARGCADAVAAGKPLEEAVLEQQLFEPLYARMLVTGAKSGTMDQVVTRLSELFSEDAAEATERLTGLVEPVLSGLLTLAVGVTLIAAMLPLVGMLGAIG